MSGSRIATALDLLEESIANDPAKARARLSLARASFVDGLTCRITGEAGESIESDMPASVGGDGAGPSPGWLFRASLAACAATVIAMQAARRGIALTALEVAVDGENDTRGILGVDDEISAGYSAIRTDVRISATNASTEQLHELVRWASDHSPVCCTVRAAPENALRVTVT